MCKITANGYEFKSTGRTLINPRLEELRKEEINELYNTSSNAMDTFKLRRNIHELINDMQIVINSVDNAVEEMKKHSASCPIEPTVINRMIDAKKNSTIEDAKDTKISPFEEARIETIKRYNKATFFNFVSVMKAFSILITSITIIIAVVLAIASKFNGD